MSNYLMVPVKPVKADLLTDLNQTIYVPIATKNTYGSVKIGDGLNIDNGVISFDESEVTILSISLNGEPLTIDSDKNVDIELSKNDVGLDQVDNTSDMDKPISTAQQTALNLKLDKKQSSADIGKVAYVNDDGDIDFKNADTIVVKLNDEVIDTDAGIFNFSNNFTITSIEGGQINIDLSEEFKESVGKIDSISLNGVPQTIDVNKNVNLVIPIDNKLDKSNADRDVLTNQTISINGDNVSLVNSYINLNSLITKTQSNNFSLANDTQAGLMSVSDYKSIRDLQARVGQLEQKATRLLYDEKLYPTAEEINTFVTSLGYTAPFEGIAVVVSGTNHIWHYYEGDVGWKDDGVDVVSQFTNDVAGIIKGAAIDGKVYAETDGTGSVYGWNSLNTRVSNIENDLEGIDFTNYATISDLSNYLNKSSTSTDGTSTITLSNSDGQLTISVNVDNLQKYYKYIQKNNVIETFNSGTTSLPKVGNVLGDGLVASQLVLSDGTSYMQGCVNEMNNAFIGAIDYSSEELFLLVGKFSESTPISSILSNPGIYGIASDIYFGNMSDGYISIINNNVIMSSNAYLDSVSDDNKIPKMSDIPTININGVAQSTLNFDSDPQTQIDNINESIGNISTILATIVTVSEV